MGRTTFAWGIRGAMDNGVKNNGNCDRVSQGWFVLSIVADGS